MKEQETGNIWSHMKLLFQDRHSVRAYLDKPVPDHLLSDILETASRSPSGGNLQPWKVHVLTGAMKKRVGAAVRQAYWGGDSEDEYSYYPEDWTASYNNRRKGAAEKLYSALALGRRDVKGKREQQARNYDFFGAPVGLIFTMDKDLSQGSWLDMGMYINSISTLSNAAGLGTCLQASFISYHNVIRQVLNIAEDQIILCGMAIGYEDKSHPVNSFRTDRIALSETVIHSNHERQNLGARFLENGKVFKNKTALKIGPREICWEEFAENIKRQAPLIQEKYEGRDEFPILMENSVEFAVLFAAGQVAGKNVQVLDPAWPTDWVYEISDEQWICKGLLEGAESTANPININIDLEAPFYTGFTSGSTGKPKGFVRSQRSWLESFGIDSLEFDLSPDDVVATIGNFTHSLPLYALVRALYEGATSICFPTFHPGKVLQELKDQQVTMLYAVPTQLDALCRAADSGQSLDHVKWVLSSGAKCSEELYRKLEFLFPNAELAEFYGSSELSFISVAKKSENIPDTSVGRVLDGVNLEIRDYEGRPCKAGEIGRVYIQSPLQFIGYLGHEKHDAANGLYTGDTGYLNATGYLFLTGRFDRMLNVKGRNIFPEMIEHGLCKFQQIIHAAVFGVEDQRRGEDIVAVVEVTSAITHKDVIENCRKHLPDYALPRKIYLAKKWHFTSSGKTDYPQLKDLLNSSELELLT